MIQSWNGKTAGQREVSGKEDYNELVKQGGTRFLTDKEAKEILYDWYGFAKEKLVIQKTVPAYQMNRHHQLRKTVKWNAVRHIMPQTGIISGLTAGECLMNCTTIHWD